MLIVGSKIVIFGGTGGIGKELTRSLIELSARPRPREIVWIGRAYSDEIEGRIRDFRDAAAIAGNHTNISFSDNYDSVEGADIVVVTAGHARRVSMERTNLLKNNAPIIRNIGEAMREKAPHAFIIVATNTVDSMTAHMLNVTGGSPERICGVGAEVDSARFRNAIAGELKKNPRMVTNAIVLGEHGQSMVPIFSRAMLNGQPVEELVNEEQRARILSAVQNGGRDIIQLIATGGATQAPAAAIANVIESYIGNKRDIITTSLFLEGQFGGIEDVCMGTTGIVDAKGVRVVETPVSPSEELGMHISAQAIKLTNAELNML